jgi:CheY-like chemotaxis protein
MTATHAGSLDAAATAAAKRFLVIDDDADLREAEVELFRTDGHEVEGASDGRLGLEAAVGWKPDVILLESALHGAMSAGELVDRLRADPRTAAIPVILI